MKENNFVKCGGKTVYIFNNVNSREEAEKQKPDNAIVVSWYDPEEDKAIYGYVFESELPFYNSIEATMVKEDGERIIL